MHRITGDAGLYLLAGLRRQPCAPAWPPASLIEGCPCQPCLWVARNGGGTGVVAIFALGRRVDDARDMARLRQDEGLILGPHLFDAVKAATPMRDMVGFAGDGAERQLDVRQADRPPEHRKRALGKAVLL